MKNPNRAMKEARHTWDNGLTDGCRVSAVMVICATIIEAANKKWSYEYTLGQLGIPTTACVSCDRLAGLLNRLAEKKKGSK